MRTKSFKIDHHWFNFILLPSENVLTFLRYYFFARFGLLEAYFIPPIFALKRIDGIIAYSPSFASDREAYFLDVIQNVLIP